MKKLIKNIFKAVLLLFIVMIITMTGIFFYGALRNYYGYCKETGIILSTEERLNRAIAQYLKEQYSVDYNEIRRVAVKKIPEYGKTREKENGLLEFIRKVEDDFELIPYKTAEEFLKENPGCCELTWVLGREGYQIMFWERAFDSGNGVFEFKHKIRYRTKDGKIKEMISCITWYSVYNCGYARSQSENTDRGCNTNQL